MQELQALAAPIIARRRTLAILWGALLAIGVAGRFSNGPGVIVFAWAFSMVILLITLASAKLDKTEAAVLPMPYRYVSGALLAVCIEGIALGMLPHASDASKIFAVMFGLVGVLAFRAVVATGPRAIFGVACIALWAWVPPVLLMAIGCRRHAPEPHWTEHASWTALQFMLALVVLSLAIALVAWKPRTDYVPEARIR